MMSQASGLHSSQGQGIATEYVAHQPIKGLQRDYVDTYPKTREMRGAIMGHPLLSVGQTTMQLQAFHADPEIKKKYLDC